LLEIPDVLAATGYTSVRSEVLTEVLVKIQVFSEPSINISRVHNVLWRHTWVCSVLLLVVSARSSHLTGVCEKELVLKCYIKKVI
jgi:lysine/ornithine N-monooxygenase